MSRPTPDKPWRLLVGGVVVVGGLVALLEWTRPLPSALDSPRADRVERVPTAAEGEWTLIHHGEPGRWRELRTPTGQQVIIPRPPSRIVSQTLLTDEVLLELCQRERLLAVTRVATDPKYSNVVAQASTFAEHVADNTEHILGLRPDLVFMASYSTPETVEHLEKAGAPVLQLHHFDSIASIRENIRIVGFAVGRDLQAEALIRRMDAAIAAAVALNAQRKTKPRVVAWSEGSVPARGTIIDDVLRIVGAINVPGSKGLDGWPRLSAEKVAQWRPDVILIDAAPGDEAAARAALLRNPAIDALVAGGGTRVVTVPSAVFIVASHHVTRFVELAAVEVFAQ